VFESAECNYTGYFMTPAACDADSAGEIEMASLEDLEKYAERARRPREVEPEYGSYGEDGYDGYDGMNRYHEDGGYFD